MSLRFIPTPEPDEAYLPLGPPHPKPNIPFHKTKGNFSTQCAESRFKVHPESPKPNKRRKISNGERTSTVCLSRNILRILPSR
jgi:hypothetical protein